MENPDHKIGDATALRLRTLRVQQGMTLEQLARQSGVSRAMISRIERGETSPTAVLLARLAAALGETLSSFFAAETEADPYHPRAAQHEWIDPESGYIRRAVSPPGTGSGVDLVEVVLPPAKQVSFPPQASSVGIFQHVWVLDGTLTLECQGKTHVLKAGDCFYHDIGRGHRFENSGTQPVRYAVILEHRRPR